jgi:general stress protein 26
MSKPMTIVSTSSDDSESLIRDYLKKHSSGVLATSDMVGNVRSSVVYFDSNDDLQLIVSTKRETQKFKNLVENSAFSMTIYNEAEQSTLDITGHAYEIQDPKKREAAINNMTIQSLMKSGRIIPPAEKLIAGDYAILGLNPMVMRLAIYARTGPGENIFETLILA